MNKRSSSRVVFLFSLLLLPAVLQAESSSGERRGRLPDGRPYRIDPASGLRLSDYVAELEVTADDLRRQMVALEDQIHEQRQQIAEYEKRTGLKLAPKIKEATLVEKSALPPAKSAPISCGATEPQIAAMSARIKELEAQAKSPPAAPVSTCDYNSPANPLLAEVTVLRKQLAEAPSKDVLSANREEVERLQQRLDATTQVALEREQQIARLQAAAKEETIRDESPAPPEQRARQTNYDNAPVSNSGDRAEFVAALNRLQSLVLERKNLLDAVKKTGKGIAVSIQPLTTKGKVTLDDMRLNVQRFQNGQDPNGIRNSLAELEQILNEDISVLRRLSSR